MTQVTSPKHWSPVLLDTLQTLQKDLHLSPQTGSSYRRWGWVHHLAEVVNDVGLTHCCYERRAHLALCPCFPKVKSLIGHQKCYSSAVHWPQVHWDSLTSHLCWAWLTGSDWDWEHMQGLPHKWQSGATSNIYNIYWTSSSLHIITTPLPLQVDTSGLTLTISPLCEIIKTVS